MHRRIVIKLGTSVLTGGSDQLARPHMVELTRQCAELYADDKELIICTSGAIAAGRERLGFPDLPATVANKQLLAAVGQSRLMMVWESLFDLYNIHVGQILLTRADIESRTSYLNARDTLRALLNRRIVPIINENDAVATEEIKVGDNDNLSAMATILAGADLLLLLTDQPGLYTADPRSNSDAQLIPEVAKIDDGLRALAGDSVSGLGVGGMATKLQAADMARRAGADVIIAAGSAPNVIVRAVAGESLGTRFPAIETPVESRKKWLLTSKMPAGYVTIDDGAAIALRQKGKSLLPAGIAKVVGDFERGDIIRIQTLNRSPLARGIVRYNSSDLAKLAGKRSNQIDDILGYDYGAVAVHRNDLILL